MTINKGEKMKIRLWNAAFWMVGKIFLLFLFALIAGYVFLIIRVAIDTTLSIECKATFIGLTVLITLIALPVLVMSLITNEKLPKIGASELE